MTADLQSLVDQIVEAAEHCGYRAIVRRGPQPSAPVRGLRAPASTQRIACPEPSCRNGWDALSARDCASCYGTGYINLRSD